MGIAGPQAVLGTAGGRFTVVRYDGRGMGLSDPYTGEFTEETRQLDLEAVLTAVGVERAALLGISEGGWTAATYALQHPERIRHLVLYGGYSRGAQARPGYDAEEDQALVTLIRKGWGRDTPAFRQVFTSQFFRRDADPGFIAHFNELQRVSATPETAARYHESSTGGVTGGICSGSSGFRRWSSIPGRPGRELRQGTPAGFDHSRRATRIAPKRHALFPDGQGGRDESRRSDRAIPPGVA